MKNFLIILSLIGLVVFLFMGAVIGSYNNLVSLRNQAQTQEAQIEAQMQRRADLIPNVVEATKGGMAQEKTVFASIAKAYALFQNAPSGSTDKLAAGDQLGSAIRGYLVVVQQYPQLKSLDLVRDLTTELEGTENRISVARQRYNESVLAYNQARQSFPGSLIAGFFNFQPIPLFQADSGSKTAPKINFSK